MVSFVLIKHQLILCCSNISFPLLQNSQINLSAFHINILQTLEIVRCRTSRKLIERSLFLRSSRPNVFCKKGVFRQFAKFTGKHLCQSLFFNKVAGLRPKACNFIKKESLAQVFSCEFCEISKNTFSYRTPPLAASIFFQEPAQFSTDSNTKSDRIRPLKCHGQIATFFIIFR